MGLQSLFIWIFYLFEVYGKADKRNYVGFNPYSSGFSIYFIKCTLEEREELIASILILLDFLSI